MTSKLFIYLKHASNAGLLLLVFLLSWQTRWIAQQGMINGNPSEYLTVSVYAIDILLSVLIIDMLICAYARNNIFGNFKFSKRKSLILFGAIFILWSTLSIIWASDKILAMQRVGWLVLAAGLAWLVVKYENKAQLIFWFVMGLMLSAWLGVWQFVFQTSFANKWLGLAMHDPQAGGTSIVEIYSSNGSPIRWLRAYGSFDHPNMFGTAMMMGILLVLWLLANKKIKSGSDSGTLQNVAIATKCNIFINKKKIILYPALASMSAGLFISLSRNAWAGLALGIIIMTTGLLRSTLRNKVRASAMTEVRTWLKPLGVVVVVFAIMAMIYSAQFLMRSGETGRLEVKSIDDRAQYFQQGKNVIKNNLLFGTGIGNYINTLKNNNSNDPAWVYQPVHDAGMLIWAETGIFSILIAVAFFAALSLYVWRAEDVPGMALAVALVPSLLLDHWLWDLHFGILLLGFTIGILMSDNKYNICK